jgi:ethylbenzene dioxygenase subunit alpha
VIRAFLNACMHRGNKVCHAEWGSTRAFTCSYHGWSYATDGSLAAVPLEKEIYGELDRGPLALHPVAQVDSYKGLVFGTFAADGPSLREYLGDITWYIDILTDASPGGIALIGTPFRVEIPGNWKLPVENAIGDGYHVTWAHAGAMSVLVARAMENASVLGIGMNNSAFDPSTSVELVVGPHTVLSGLDGQSGYIAYDNPGPGLAYLERNRPRVIERLGALRGGKMYGSEMHIGIFPNVQIIQGLNFIRVIHPKGPGKFEVWTYGMVERDAPQEVKDIVRFHIEKTFGPAGMLEGDDGDFVEAITHSAGGYATRHVNGYLGMGAGRTISWDGPGEASPGIVNEHCQRAFYRQWERAMRAPDARTIIAADSPVARKLQRA